MPGSTTRVCQKDARLRVVFQSRRPRTLLHSHLIDGKDVCITVYIHCQIGNRLAYSCHVKSKRVVSMYNAMRNGTLPIPTPISIAALIFHDFDKLVVVMSLYKSMRMGIAAINIRFDY